MYARLATHCLWHQIMKCILYHSSYCLKHICIKALNKKEEEQQEEKDGSENGSFLALYCKIPCLHCYCIHPVHMTLYQQQLLNSVPTVENNTNQK